MKNILTNLPYKFPTLAMYYRHFRDNKNINHEPKETPMGFKLAGNKSMENGQFEIKETEIVKNILDDVDVFINIGANIGYYCCIALQKRKKTIAIEPLNRNLHFLYKNIKANNWENNIEIFPMALSDKTGIMEIYGSGTGASLIPGWAGNTTKKSTVIPVNTLDNIFGSRFHEKKLFILVDIEGSEKNMLEGAKGILENEPKPIWMVEISVNEHQPEAIKINPDLLATFELFWSKGYKAISVGDINKIVTREEIKSFITNCPDEDICHNYIFIDNQMSINF